MTRRQKSERNERQPEFNKSVPMHVKDISGRKVTGIFSVMGNLDSYNDRLHPGAFAKTFGERGSKALFLWQHDFYSPPIAKITNLREVTRDELPPDVLAAAPDATGGAEVTREYTDTPRGNEVLSLIKSEVPLQMSFGYDAVRYDFEEDPDAKYEWEKIRNLREVRLWEVSDVLWGANDATVASKAALPIDFLLKQLTFHLKAMDDGDGDSDSNDGDADLAFIDAMIPHHQAAITMARAAMQDVTRTELRDLAARIVTEQGGEIQQLRAWRDAWYGAKARARKTGARHSAADIEKLNAIASHALDLGATNIKLVDPEDTDDDKAEPVHPLTLERMALDLLQLAAPTR